MGFELGTGEAGGVAAFQTRQIGFFGIQNADLAVLEGQDLNQAPLGFESGTGQLEGLAAFQNGQIGFFLEVLEGNIIRGPFLISNPSGWVSNNFWRGTPSKIVVG